MAQTYEPPRTAEVYYIPYSVMKQRNFKQWEIGMGEAPCKEPGTWCFSCFCLPCKTLEQRQRTADPGPDFRCLDMGCYGCCQCFDGCCICPKTPCMCLEAFCCTPWAVLTIRHRVQYKWSARNSDCDNVLLCCFWCAEICPIFFNNPRIKAIANLLICMCLACMLTQQQVEMDRGIPAPQQQVMAVPGVIVAQQPVVYAQQPVVYAQQQPVVYGQQPQQQVVYAQQPQQQVVYQQQQTYQ